MPQTLAVRQLDAIGSAKLLRSFVPGTSLTFTDTATYTPPGGSATPSITVLVDRDVLTVGADSEVVQPATKITVYRVDVDAPIYGGLFTLGTGELFKVDRIESSDESLSICIVNLAPP